jgi:hypothetical protein
VQVNKNKKRKPAFSQILRRWLDSYELNSYAFSIALHAVVVILLILMSIAIPSGGAGFRDGLIVMNSRLDSVVDDDSTSEESVNVSPVNVQSNEPVTETTNTNADTSNQSDDNPADAANNGEIESNVTEQHNVGEGLPPTLSNIGRTGTFISGGGVGGRNVENRAKLRAFGETSRESENAVEAGLAWIAAQQNKDGGWKFNFDKDDSESSGNGLCTNGGTHPSRVAATSISILAFLGAGYTPERETGSKYWRNVDRGLSWLLKHGTENKIDGSIDFRDFPYQQGMYSQAIAVLALVEAAAMVKDGKIKAALAARAQGGVNFIVKSQDIQHTGGWRYTPRETPGDVSVTGWQLMAMKGAAEAGVVVPKPTLYRANDFLDLIQYDEGRQYTYILETEKIHSYGIGRDSRKTCTALGNLCRIYLGWQPGEPTLDNGVELIKEWRPLLGRNECNIYYAYIASLVLHHYGGDGWEEWFKELRDHLVATQSKNAHDSGSWYVPDHYSDKGGRLYNTALAVMILEVPYRYLPLYRKQ